MSYQDEDKYSIVNDLAYNEDNILIYNIFVYDLPRNGNKRNVLEYFSKFGEVLKFGFLGNARNGKKCYVNFADPKAAAKTLKTTVHVFMHHNISVKPCWSWHQPNGRSIINQINNYSKNDCVADLLCTFQTDDHQQTNILSLNDDCLEYICRKLDFDDQINFALSSTRFCDVFKMLSNAKYVNLKTDCFSSMTQFQTHIFLQIVGPQVKNLMIDFSCGLFSYFAELTYVNFLGLFCTNVENLTIDASTLDGKKIKTLIKKMPQLKELKMNSVEVNESLIYYLKTLQCLKSLDITDNEDITGKNIEILTGLEKLSLNECRNIRPLYFRKICQNLKNLQYLDISSCTLLKTEDFQHILQHLQQLEAIKITTSKENINCLAQLPKLKRLEVSVCEGKALTTEFFQLLVNHQSEQLEELKFINAFFFDTAKASLIAKLKKLKCFHSYNGAINDEILKTFQNLSELENLEIIRCDDISDKAILQLLENSHKLTRLYLKYCNSLTPDLIRNSFKLLREQSVRSKRSHRLNLILSKNHIMQMAVDEIELQDNSDVLKVTLEDNETPHVFLDYPDDDDDDYYDYDDDYNYPFDDYLRDYSDDEDYENDFIDLIHMNWDGHDDLFFNCKKHL